MQRDVSLRSFFSFIERRGGGTFPRSEVENELGADAEGREILLALMRAEVVTKARYALRMPCPEGRSDCDGRGVEQHFDSGRETLHGVCTARRRRCGSIELVDETALARVTIGIPEVGGALRRAFGVDGVCALNGYLLNLGEEEIAGQNPRDVLFLPRPDYASLGAFLEDRERAFRASLVLVPTGGSLATELRARFGPGSRVEVALLSDRVVLRAGRLSVVPRDAVASTEIHPLPVRAAVAPSPMRLVLECIRRERGMIITANGEKVDLPDAAFALLVKVVDAHLRDREAWSAFRSLGIKRGATWRTNHFFAGVVPEGFEVIKIDRKKQCQLNPVVVIERVDWRSVAAHPDEEVKHIAERHLALARADPLAARAL